MNSRGKGLLFDRRGQRWIIGGGVASFLFLAFAPIAVGQRPGSTRTLSVPVLGPESASPRVSRNVSGRVTNGLSGVPIPRALVNVSGRSVLTDAQGHFTLPEFTQQEAYVRVTKPGFTEAQDGVDGSGLQRLTLGLDAPLELTLMPDGLVTGTVTGLDGAGLARVRVQLRAERFDLGAPRWNQVGFSFTDAHGIFRLVAPPGKYRLKTGFSPRTADRGDAILPVTYPKDGVSGDGDFFDLGSGEERRVDLRPRMGPPRALIVHVEGAELQAQLQLTAGSGNGDQFAVAFQRTGVEGDYLVELPGGSYTIEALSTSRERTTEGTAKVSVASGGTSTARLVLTELALFPVQVITDGHGGLPQSDELSALRSLSLYLRNIANDGDGNHTDAQLAAGLNGAVSFQVRSGRYRFASIVSGGGWYVKAASVGSSNLMEDELVVGPGAAGSSLQIVLSNATGLVHGTVAQAVQPGPEWVYLIPMFDSLIPYFEAYVQPNGTFSWSGPVGNYHVAALDHRLREDIHDPAVRRRLLSNERMVEVTLGVDTPVILPAPDVRAIHPAEVPQ